MLVSCLDEDGKDDNWVYAVKRTWLVSIGGIPEGVDAQITISVSCALFDDTLVAYLNGTKLLEDHSPETCGSPIKAGWCETRGYEKNFTLDLPAGSSTLRLSVVNSGGGYTLRGFSLSYSWKWLSK